MPRTKSRSSQSAATARKNRSSRSGSKNSSRAGDAKVRRYLDFIRAILSPRNGR